MNRNEIVLGYLLNARNYLQAYRAQLVLAKDEPTAARIAYLLNASIEYQFYRTYLGYALKLQTTQPEYEEALAEYGVFIMDNDDISQHEELSEDIVLDEFQLNVIDEENHFAALLNGVRLTAEWLALYVSLSSARRVTPQDAFQAIFGTIEFGYVPARDFGLTITTGVNPNGPIDLSNPIYILLAQKSFRTQPSSGYSGSILPPLHPSFVIVHELGHAFHNRHGGKTEDGYAPIAASAFAQATNSIWHPADVYIHQDVYDPAIYGDPNLRTKRTLSDNTVEYLVEKGFYFERGYGNMTLGDIDTFFFNERLPRGNPSEGFADTFANIILNPEILPDGSTRPVYFYSNIIEWVTAILER